MKGFLIGIVLLFVVPFGVGGYKGYTNRKTALEQELQTMRAMLEEDVQRQKEEIDRKNTVAIDKKRAEARCRREEEKSKFDKAAELNRASFESQIRGLEQAIAKMEGEKDLLQVLRRKLGSEKVMEFQAIGEDIVVASKDLDEANALFEAFNRTKWMSQGFRELRTIVGKLRKDYETTERKLREAASLLQTEDALLEPAS